MKVYFNPLTTMKTLSLKASDHLFITTFKTNNDEEKCKLIKEIPFDVIARIAHNGSSFELFCHSPELTDCWNELWCSYGLLLTQQQKLAPVLFFSQPKSDGFNLVRGAYFFNLSQRIARAMKIDFLYSEVEYLKIASGYKSVHALQRYNECLYEQLKTASDDDKEPLFREIIKNSQSMLPEYGSFGYMVLAESLGHYALWLIESHQSNKAQKMLNSAFKSLDYAQSTLEASTYSIHNASLGRGLALSNSLSVDAPEAVKHSLKERFEELRKTMHEAPAGNKQ